MREPPRIERIPGWLTELHGALAAARPETLPVAASPAVSGTVGRRRWWLLAGLLAPTGVVLTLVGLALTLDVLSLRYWSRSLHVPLLAGITYRARGAVAKSDAQILEGILASIGLGLVATALILVLAALIRSRPASRGARFARLALCTVGGAMTVGLVIMALAVPFLALKVPARLAGLVDLVAVWVAHALKILPFF